LPDPPPSEAWFEAQTQENPDLATGSQQLDEEIIRLAEGEDEDSPKGSGNEDSSSSSESESDGHDSLLSALQEEFGTDSDGAGESSKPKPNNVHSRVRRNKYEVPASNIAVLVLACWTMRIPVIYMDFIR
jgi:RNA polymerase I-specific transcription initiation factor RRN7